MATLGWLAVNAAFGALCAAYVSVVGFAVSATLIIVAGLLFCMLFGAPVSPQGLLLSYVALQGGYFAALLALAFLRPAATSRRVSDPGQKNGAAADFPRQKDREGRSL